VSDPAPQPSAELVTVYQKKRKQRAQAEALKGMK
jgi:hypothetical protein